MFLLALLLLALIWQWPTPDDAAVEAAAAAGSGVRTGQRTGTASGSAGGGDSGGSAPSLAVASAGAAKGRTPGPGEQPKRNDAKADEAGARPDKRPASPRQLGPPPAVDEAALRAAITARSPELQVCGATGAPERLLARLALTKRGTIKAVTINHLGPLPSAVSSCVRERVRAWRLTELQLLSDVEVVVTFHLSPERTAAASAG